ncbi:MAG TPA: bifunctional metallophosphatase/5'-nucleotidase [Kineosporiaceae bacterium]|nr:bifunctional metallophosphatase/5'-nucleotidase [Kineosporiaceae bacterium]
MPLPRTRPGRVTLGLTIVALAASALFLAASAAPASAPAAATHSTPTRPVAAVSAAKPAAAVVNAQILAFNDFHGHLEPDHLSISAKTGTSHGAGYVPAGGAAYLAAKIKAAKRANPASIVVEAGDLIGGSPMISGYYHDESTIEAMNKIVDVGVVGNHEFDEGTAEIRRIVAGGCHPVDGCQDGNGYAGTTFDMLAANVVDRSTGTSIFPGYVIKDVGGAKIGFIGTVTTDTPSLVAAAGVKDVKFLDEAATINRLAPQVRAAGADAVVVLTHNGAAQMKGAKGGINSCVGMAGSVVDVTKAVAGQVDAVISAHTHKPYICTVKGTLLTSAASYGRLLTTVQLRIDPNAHTVTKISAKNSIVTHQRTPDPAVAAVVKRYQKLIGPIANRKVGHLSRAATRDPSASGETALGDLVADAQLAETAPKAKGAAQIALAAHGFIRTDLAKGTVTYGEVYAAQPFGQQLVTMSLTGRQLDAVLELQFCNSAAPSPDQRVPLGVSRGFTYSYDPGLACGHRIRIRDFRLNGKKLTASGTVRVTVNSFYAAGENGFTALAAGTSRVTGGLERDALSSYLTANPHLSVPTRNRVKLR